MWRIKDMVSVQDRQLSVGLAYPRCDENINEILVDLIDTRAADGILIRYDFKRDGWSILQASRFEWGGDEDVDHDWQEVAFVKAWGRQKEASCAGNP